MLAVKTVHDIGEEYTRVLLDGRRVAPQVRFFIGQSD